jgi:DNA excision repair protein ERCC-1
MADNPDTPKSVADAYSDTLRPDAYDVEQQEQQTKEQQAKVKTLLETLATLPSGAQFLKVSHRQKGNTVLKELKQVPWRYEELKPDFELGKSSCAVFLSLRYHNLHPEYIHGRIRELGRLYKLRVLLVQVDIKSAQHPLSELAKVCVMHGYTLMACNSAREAARYLETYKAFENRNADALKGDKPTDFLSQMSDVMTTVRSVNKTDSTTLLSTFGSFNGICQATPSEIQICPGFGGAKVERLTKVLDQPFRKRAKMAASSKAVKSSDYKRPAVDDHDDHDDDDDRTARATQAAEAFLVNDDDDNDDLS